VCCSWLWTSFCKGSPANELYGTFGSYSLLGEGWKMGKVLLRAD
jgi:hypothetical protein